MKSDYESIRQQDVWNNLVNVALSEPHKWGAEKRNAIHVQKHTAEISVLIVIRSIAARMLVMISHGYMPFVCNYQRSVTIVGSKSYWFELITLSLHCLIYPLLQNSCLCEQVIPSSSCLAITQRARWTYSYKRKYTAHLSSIRWEKH
jgi:hypothetical protein